MAAISQIERRVLIKQYGKKLWMLRALPWHAATLIAGIELPPHERQWLRLFFADYTQNDIVASRGTSKSFTHSSLAAPLKALLSKNLGILSVSASGFRGGKLLMDDSERLFHGTLKSQRQPGPFMTTSTLQNKVVKREVDKWTIQLKSQSHVMTIPTNNADNMRGIRANLVLVDERNTFPGEAVQQVIRPMLNVGLDFRKTASGGDRNQIFQISTIDYTLRDWYPELEASRKLARREYDAQQARRAGDWKEYERLMREDDGALQTASISYTRVDYTDLLIPETVDDFEGNRYRVDYPRPKDIEREDLLRYDKREGRALWYTYPVDKKGLEEPMRNGTMDPDLWLAEQRNVFISAAGNVYPHELIQKVAEAPIYGAGSLKGYEHLDDFYAPVMYSCGDPCVLGVDYARESDYFALVVIRAGELADRQFEPSMLLSADELGRPCLGKTTWNNVIWAEAWQKWTAKEAAEKVREMYMRYNIVSNPMKMLRGIGMDKGGGGTAVRDELAKPTPKILSSGEVDPGWQMPVRIFDPEDDDYKHYASYGKPAEYSGSLELIKPTNFDNIDWTGASKGFMQAKKLYLAYYFPPSVWAVEKGLVNERGYPDDSSAEYHKWSAGYQGVRRLKNQLLRLQAKHTDAGVTRFVMPADREKEEGKKDLYSAFIYATHMLRQHLSNATKKERPTPMTAPVIVQVGSDRRNGRGDSWFRRVNL